MKKNSIVEKVEFESVLDPVTKVITVKKYKHTRKCVRIREGKRNLDTFMMDYTDVSDKELDMAEVDNPDVATPRYVITYDNLSKVEIP